ncbi:vomeronasal type-2 receptor 26-like [Protopterus annectens]|uniref:vomeronasal type-2 receptor 26-like n=1 Tax=Protopterus annectens TaxID=7888 RepID=UPI001CFA8DB8|nr:vomeronasal type-2 receptor 26-like [Protopterus annectens]
MENKETGSKAIGMIEELMIKIVRLKKKYDKQLADAQHDVTVAREEVNTLRAQLETQKSKAARATNLANQDLLRLQALLEKYQSKALNTSVTSPIIASGGFSAEVYHQSRMLKTLPKWEEQKGQADHYQLAYMLVNGSDEKDKKNVNFQKAVMRSFLDYLKGVPGDIKLIYEKSSKTLTELVDKLLGIPLSVCSESCTMGYRKAIQQGQPSCCFDCIPCSEGEVSNGTGMNDCIKCLEDQWPNSRRDRCIRKTAEFLAYEDPLGSALTSVTTVLLLLNCFVCITFVKFRHTPVVRANNRQLSYILLFALMLCFLCSLAFIGQPKNVTCMLQQATFGIIFTLCVSCVLSKTIMVVIVFKATNPRSNLRKWLGYKLPLGIIFLGTLIQFMICIIWLAYFPPSLEHNRKSVTGKILIECNDGSLFAFWCMLGYIGFLASFSLVVAFLARKLPDDFNEAKYICFSMLVFVSVWLSFIPAYLSTKGKYMVALEVFAILSSSAGLQVCIFLPKCYIIIFRPDLNTRKVTASNTTERDLEKNN